MSVAPWAILLLCVPVLWLGESTLRRIHALSRFNVPAPVVGGLTVATVALVATLAGLFQVDFDLSVSARSWNWLITPEPVLFADPAPARSVYLQFMFAFFACVGLNGSWPLLRGGGRSMLYFLVATTLLAATQMVVGVVVAGAVGASPLLGLLCGPLGTLLIRRHRLVPKLDTGTKMATLRSPVHQAGFIDLLRRLRAEGWTALWHLAILLACLKLGAWASHALEQISIDGRALTFPGYMGAMIVGIAPRNALDLSGRPLIQTRIVSLWMFVTLEIFLAAAVMSLDLLQLADVALPMLCVLIAQVALMAAFAWAVTFRLMGRDYDAAVMAGGHCGFGLGATPNAMANMESLVKSHGPAPRAFLVVPIIGGFVLDFSNAAVILIAINLLA
jgi:ESS family glutamate:Na+ symporter